MSPALEKELRKQLERLAPGQQQRVIDFARALVAGKTRGVSGKALLRFGGAIEREELTTIEKAIEDGCEQVHPDEW